MPVIKHCAQHLQQAHLTPRSAGFLDRLHKVEKHIRKNKLRATFTDQLGRVGGLDEVASLREAHQLAFYIFWNVKPHFQRCGPKCPPCPAAGSAKAHALLSRGLLQQPVIAVGIPVLS